jgi:Tol biopolymer transport system component
MNVDGSDRRQLTHHDGFEHQPVFSPDGSHVFFLRTVEERQNIWVINADGSGQRRLLKSAQESLFFLDPWSPDGSGFVFLATPVSAPRVGIQPVVQVAGADLYVVSSDGSNVHRLTTVQDATTANFLGLWSRDGSRIAFMSDRDGNWEVWVMEANGQHQRQLTHTDGASAVNGPVAWSPDDQHVFFSSSRDAPDKNPWIFTDIYVINVEGGQPRRLTHTLEAGGFARAFSWDADGVRGFWSPDGDLQKVGAFRLTWDDYVVQPLDEPIGHGASCTPDKTEGDR